METGAGRILKYDNSIGGLGSKNTFKKGTQPENVLRIKAFDGYFAFLSRLA